MRLSSPELSRCSPSLVKSSELIGAVWCVKTRAMPISTTMPSQLRAAASSGHRARHAALPRPRAATSHLSIPHLRAHVARLRVGYFILSVRATMHATMQSYKSHTQYGRVHGPVVLAHTTISSARDPATASPSRAPAIRPLTQSLRGFTYRLLGLLLPIRVATPCGPKGAACTTGSARSGCGPAKGAMCHPPSGCNSGRRPMSGRAQLLRRCHCGRTRSASCGAAPLHAGCQRRIRLRYAWALHSSASRRVGGSGLARRRHPERSTQPLGDALRRDA